MKQKYLLTLFFLHIHAATNKQSIFFNGSKKNKQLVIHVSPSKYKTVYIVYHGTLQC